MRNIIALFFLFIFTFQVLPVRALGKLLAKGQLTEEVKEDCTDKDEHSHDEKDDSSDGIEEKFNDLAYSFDHILPLCSSISNSSLELVHDSYDLPNSHILDIHCPPPNL